MREFVDGDTIKVRFEGRKQSLRLIGIDTPEIYGGEECGARQASASMKDMLNIGQRLRLTRDPSQDRRDRYGRLLRYVNAGEMDVGRAQVRKGLAHVYVYERPFRRVDGYRRFQRQAKAHNSGVWGRCDGHFHKPL